MNKNLANFQKKGFSPKNLKNIANNALKTNLCGISYKLYRPSQLPQPIQSFNSIGSHDIFNMKRPRQIDQNSGHFPTHFPTSTLISLERS